MAEQHCTGACVRCGTAMHWVKSDARGRPRKYCDVCSHREKKLPEPKTPKYRRIRKVWVICGYCETPRLLARGEQDKQFCSRHCANKGRAIKRGFHVKAMQAFCVQCGIEFRPNPRTENIGKFCTRECYDKHRKNGKELVAWIHSLGRENRERRLKYERETRVGSGFCGPIRPIAGPGSIGTCKGCQSEYVRAMLWQHFCSGKCKEASQGKNKESRKEYAKRRRKTAKGRADKKLYKTLRRRRELAEYEAIDPIQVLTRDRWVCQLCGIKTPRALRGTNEPNAPELDHVIPLALGGSHTWGNLQCLCRTCNGKKGARSQGQLGLPIYTRAAGEGLVSC